MKYFLASLPVILLSASLFSCGGKTETASGSTGDSSSTAVFDTKGFEGEYVGDFGDGHIVVVLSYVQGKNVSGYNVHKGLRRNIKGTLTETAGEYRFLLNEPGDNKYDGVFDFTLNPTDFSGKGHWTPNNKDIVKAKNFNLAWRLRDSSENQFVGYWDGPDMLEIKSDGIVEMTYWESIAGTDGEESEQRKLRGQWLSEGNTITIEWPKNTHNNGEKYVLAFGKNEEGYYALADKDKKREYYQY